jgi:F-type H+-transporting ATPase subunit epsilon
VEKIRLRIVTPARMLFDEEVDEVTAPGSLGEFGVLPLHISFLTLLDIGEMSYKQREKRYYLALAGGYAEVVDDVMTVLADAAEPADEIDVERARRAKEQAEKRLAEREQDEQGLVAAQAALRRALVRLKVASRGTRG